MEKLLSCTINFPTTDLHLIVEPAHTRVIRNASGMPNISLAQEVRDWCVQMNIPAQHSSAYGRCRHEGQDYDAYSRVLVLKFKTRSDMALFKLAWDGIIPG